MTKIDTALHRSPWPYRRLLFAAIIVFVYFFGLTIPLLGPDEPRYAQVAREMFERGDWVTPTLGGHTWFEKPALLYWLQIGAYNVFGVSEFSARIGSALFGLGTIGAMWVLGRAATATGSNASTGLGDWAGLIAASSLGLIVFARGGSFDIILTFPITAAMVCFFIFDQRSSDGGTSKSFLPLAGFYFFIGTALLAKGLVGALFPLAIVAFYFVLSFRFPSRAFILSLFWGGVLTLAVASVWYVPVYLRNGWPFVDEFFIQHHFQRYTSNKYLHPQPFYFFFWVLPLMTLPWLPFLAAGLWSAVRSLAQRQSDSGPGKNAASASTVKRSFTPLFLFSLSWMLVPLVFFSFSGSKLPGYILPALPPALMIATLSVQGFVSGSERRSRMVQATVMATFAVVTALLIFVVPRFAEMDSVKGLIGAAADKGYRTEKVLTLYTVSHNAEFYAPGRLIRDGEGKQRQLNNTGELAEAMSREGISTALVLYPIRLQEHLTNGREISAELIADNGEFGIAAVRRQR